MFKPDLSNVKDVFKLMYYERSRIHDDMLLPKQRYDICLFLDMSPDCYDYVKFANSDISIDDLIYLIKKTDEITEYDIIGEYDCTDEIIRDIKDEYSLYKLFIMLKTKIELNPRNRIIADPIRGLLASMAHHFRNISHDKFQKIPNELLNEYLDKFMD